MSPIVVNDVINGCIMNGKIRKIDKHNFFIKLYFTQFENYFE
jgi:hypothetical protein